MAASAHKRDRPSCGASKPTELANELLDWAPYVNAQRQDAKKLVLDAWRHEDSTEAPLILMRAKLHYPACLDNDSLIQGEESLVSFKIISGVKQDIVNAEGALHDRRFSEARQHCNQKLSRGLNLEASNNELRPKRREA